MFHSYFSQSHTKGNINSSYKHIIYVLATLKSKKVAKNSDGHCEDKRFNESNGGDNQINVIKVTEC